MNREQYLAKRMWLHGAAPESDTFAETRRPAGDRGFSSPALSQGDRYQRFHQGVSPGKRTDEKAN